MVGPWTFGGFFWGVSVFLSRWFLPICSSTAASVCVHGHRVCSRASTVPWSICRRVLHDGRGRGTADRGILAWQPNQFAPAAEGCPVCSTSRSQLPTWCDLWRCREMITKLHFEGVRRDIPGPTPSTGNNPTTGRGVSPGHPGRRRSPNFYTTGTNPRTGHHWTAFLCPVIRRRRRHFGITTGEK